MTDEERKRAFVRAMQQNARVIRRESCEDLCALGQSMMEAARKGPYRLREFFRACTDRELEVLANAASAAIKCDLESR